VIVEVPLVLHYNHKASKSKIKILSTVIEYGKMIVDLRREKIY